jgi:hypothetical protein
VHASTLSTLAIAIAIGGVASAQQAATEGVVAGRVVEAGSNHPIAGAQVRALGPSGTFETTTDAEGRYEIESIPPDAYTVAARANGFVDSHFGQSAGASLGLGAEVVVRGGQVTAGIDLALQLAGQISGRILPRRATACQASRSN